MNHEKLECYKQLVEVAEEVARRMTSWPRGHGDLVDQLRRAMASVVLNLAEGNSRKSMAERRRFFEIARGSVIEVAACIDLARAFGLIPKPAALSIENPGLVTRNS
jgi:four helix bundle protein